MAATEKDSEGNLPEPAVRGPAPAPGSGRFHTTHWTVVCQARDPADTGCAAALESLCRTYWYPLYAYVRRRGYAPDEAQDLTQEFFHRLLSKDYLLAADPEKGRFRTFLLVAMKRFLANEWRRSGAQKRGGDRPHVSIDQDWAEGIYRYEPVDNITPETLYERRWALLLLERAIHAVAQEMAQIGRKALFDDLKDSLTGSTPSRSYAETARKLGMSEDAVKSAAYRLRLRLRHHLHVAIRETVNTPEEVEEEIQHLFSVFS